MAIIPPVSSDAGDFYTICPAREHLGRADFCFLPSFRMGRDVL